MKVIKKVLLALVVLVMLISLFLVVRFNIIFSHEKVDLTTIEAVKNSSLSELNNNKSIAKNFYQTLYEKDGGEINKYISPNYIEHQKSANYSVNGLQSYIKLRLLDNPQHKMEIHRVIAQGDLVFLHVEEKLNDEKSIARGELFRLLNSKVVEHWSAEQAVPEEAANDNGMFSGPTPNLESKAGNTYAQKAVVDGFEAWVNFDTDRVKASTTERYIQHNPLGKDGADSFATVIKIFKVLYAATGSRVKIKTYRTISEGDFIVMHTLFTSGSDESTHVFDLVRMTEDGLKDEHWDIIEPIKKADIERVF